MMRESQTGILERGCALAGELATEPFEVAWATEARWFVQFLEPGTRPVRVQVQTSPDGLLWVDHEVPAAEAPATGMITGTAHDLGHWFRLRIEGDAPLVRISLALKE